jgi:hypothetical protein
MVKINLSPAFRTGISFLLVKDIHFLSEFFYFSKILSDLMPVLESWVPFMRFSKFGIMYLAGKFATIHTKINLLFFISTDPDFASPLRATLLFMIFRCTSKAGFLI